MGLFSSTPEEKEIYKYAGGFLLRSFFTELLKLNGLYDIVYGQSSEYVGRLIQKCLEVKTKRNRIIVSQIEPEFYLLIKKAIYIHNHHRGLFVESCPKCNKKLYYSVCDSCGFNIIDDYDINLTVLKSIEIKLPDNPRSPYSKDINYKVSRFIENKPSYKKLARPEDEIPELKRKHEPVKTKGSSGRSGGVQNIINHVQNDNVKSEPKPVKSYTKPISTKSNEKTRYTPKSCILGDLEFDIPMGFHGGIEESFTGEIIKIKNDYMKIIIGSNPAPNCINTMQGEYYMFKKANGLLSEWGDFPPQSFFDNYPRNLSLMINGFDGILRDESSSFSLAKIKNRYNYSFTEDEKYYYINVYVEEINKHINIKELLEEILPE